MSIPHGAAPNPGQSPRGHRQPPQCHLTVVSAPLSFSVTLSKPALSGQPTLPKAVIRGAALGCGGFDSHKERVPSTRLKTENHPRCTALPLIQHHLCLCCTDGSPGALLRSWSCPVPWLRAGLCEVTGCEQHRALRRKPAKPETTQTNTKQLKEGWEMWSDVLLPRNKYFTVPFRFFFFEKALALCFFKSPKWSSYSLHAPQAQHVLAHTHTHTPHIHPLMHIIPAL